MRRINLIAILLMLVTGTLTAFAAGGMNKGLPAAVQLQPEPIPGELHPNLEPADNYIRSCIKKIPRNN